MPGTPTRKGHAAVWTRSGKTTYDVHFEGLLWHVWKSPTTNRWSLDYYSEELGETRLALMDAGSSIREIWNEVTDYFKTDDWKVLVDACRTEAREAAVEEPPASGTSASAADRLAAVECPTCGATGLDKCHTSTGKTVKEHHGFHVARLQLAGVDA